MKISKKPVARIIISCSCIVIMSSHLLLAQGMPASVADDTGNSLSAEIVAPKNEDVTEQFEENFWLTDFEVHFFISLPFSAFYSYLTVVSLDGVVQGKFPPDFHTANLWMIMGAAIGSSIAVALGSLNRVPDQSIYQLKPDMDQDGTSALPDDITVAGTRIEILQIQY